MIPALSVPHLGLGRRSGLLHYATTIVLETFAPHRRLPTRASADSLLVSTGCANAPGVIRADAAVGTAPTADTNAIYQEVLARA